LLQLLQTLQISFFALSVLGFLILGLLVLLKPVLILHRRVFLLIFLPLLLANPLAVLEEFALPGENAILDWRLVLVLVFDLALIVVAYWFFQGWVVFGLSTNEVEAALQDWFESREWSFDAQTAERTTFWGGKRNARRLEASQENQVHVFWLLRQGSEIRLEGENDEAKKILRRSMPVLRHVQKPYHFQDHIPGILYLVLAVVLAVLSWIFFFEPRLILLD